MTTENCKRLYLKYNVCSQPVGLRAFKIYITCPPKALISRHISARFHTLSENSFGGQINRYACPFFINVSCFNNRILLLNINI
jgi:hypothetical protein